jgi:hypothetical protein
MKKISWILLIFFCILVSVLGSCTSKTPSAPSLPTPTPTITASVYYTVTGNIPSVFVAYYTPGGYVNENYGEAIPYTSATYTFTSGQQIGILVTSYDDANICTVTVNTYVNGNIWKTITATIYYQGTISETGSL